jgi:hypothetical protein
MLDHGPRLSCANHDRGLRPVRFLLLALSALAIASCAPRGGACDVSVTQDLAFSAARTETVTAQSFGPSCDRSIGLYTIRDAEGHPAWSWSAPLPRAFGEEAFRDMDADGMRDFLTRWAEPSLSTTQTAPAWDALTPGQTTLDRLTYDDIRARDLPMLCHSSGTARELCVFWEPAAGGAGLLLERDLEDTL